MATTFVSGVVTVSDILSRYWQDCPNRVVADPGTVLTANDAANVAVATAIMSNPLTYWGKIAGAGVLEDATSPWGPIPAANLRAKPTGADVCAQWAAAQAASNADAAAAARHDRLEFWGGLDGVFQAMVAMKSMQDFMYNQLKAASFTNNTKPTFPAYWTTLGNAIADIQSYQPAVVS